MLKETLTCEIAQNESEIERFYTVAEVAQRAGFSEQALYAAIRAGQFPALRVGKRIRIPASALRDFAASAALAGGVNNE